MDNSELRPLNEQYAIAGHVSIEPGPGELVTVKVRNAHAEACISLAGGHVMSYVPNGQQDVLWMSPNSAYTVGKALRGGIPVCWPWFGALPDHADYPMHGLVRTQLWWLAGTRALADGSTEVRLRTQDTPETRGLWPCAFAVELAVMVGARLEVALTARNTGEQPFDYTGALHSYLHVGDVSQITVQGLAGTDYLDKVDQYARKHQAGPVQNITRLTDRIYLDTSAPCVIEDPALGRKIRVRKEGSRTTVVWNPGEKAGDMPEIGAGNETRFVCVESANAAQDVVTVPAGEERRLVTQVEIV